MAEIITKDSEEFKELTGWMKKIGKSVEAATARIRPAIADEHYLQGEDVCEMLHISKRTLQTLRDEGAIPYTTIGGKILYPESALYETLRTYIYQFREKRLGVSSEHTILLCQQSVAASIVAAMKRKRGTVHPFGVW